MKRTQFEETDFSVANDGVLVVVKHEHVFG
jgi:hypothetical protein